MNYNTAIFWALFLVLILPYWLLRHKHQNLWLLLGSYVFYGFWDYRFLYLLILSTVLNFVAGLGVAGQRLSTKRLLGLSALLFGTSLLLTTGVKYSTLLAGLLHGDGAAIANALPCSLRSFEIPLGTLVLIAVAGGGLPLLFRQGEEGRRKLFMIIGIVANLALLGFFKYFDFFVASLRELLRHFGLDAAGFTPLQIILPAGISFYTFQAMSYTIDIYRKQAQPTDDLTDFALFVCYFPHLVAGPIMRATNLLPQVVNPRKFAPGAFQQGLFLVLIGLFKKLVIADNMSLISNDIFNRFQYGDAGVVTGPEVMIGIYAFALQIYGDFSGYSAIARGISKWLGYELVINFDNPYTAVSPSDFWRRWHISLSSWLRDYLYIPLGGNRNGTWDTYKNIFLTMLLGGLWHGANWTFVAWGALHGGVLSLYRVLGISDDFSHPGRLVRARRFVQIFVMFHIVCLGWLLFRADSFGSVVTMMGRLFTSHTVTSFTVTATIWVLFYAASVAVIDAVFRGEQRIQQVAAGHWLLRSTLFTYLVLMLVIFQSGESHEFIYFQF